MPTTEKKIADNLAARWGFPDGHAEIIYRPFVGKVTLNLTPEELLTAQSYIDEAVEHAVSVGALPPQRKA